MTREDMIRMAREAGFGIGPATKSIYANTPCDDQLERFAALVAAAEREQCAKVCEDIDVEYEGEDVLATWCADAIRARGEK